MEVREIMSSPVVTAAPEDTLRTAVGRMLEERVGSVVVLDGGLAGIVTESDLLRAWYQEGEDGSEAGFERSADRENANGEAASREAERQRGLGNANGEAASRSRLESMRVADVMSADLVTVTSTTSVTAALRTMQEHEVKRLPIRGGSKPLGIITLSDVAWHLPDRLRERPSLSTRQKGRGRDRG
ncbi:CBS domain-containing protein [Halovivax limisalsi]|uniref:CBS domain-containing protein n=1 Tax=Halovivax limisalsi TaxID=1453760 RepID=UPI001FFC3D6F|nr:CBS domain-containing protein [Halovivax limisalsi]